MTHETREVIESASLDLRKRLAAAIYPDGVRPEFAPRTAQEIESHD